MDVILHLGAHRTATTTFQHYLRDQREGLEAQGVRYWGPNQSRKTIFPGLFRIARGPRGRKANRRAEGRVRLFARQVHNAGIAQLLVSDENLLGTCMHNFTTERLYPAAGERVARVSAAFGGRVRRIVLTIRSPDLWWASAAALVVSRGHPVPTAQRIDRIAHSTRSWRDVITDLACAAPGAEIVVIPFEAHSGRPDHLLGVALGAAQAPQDAKKRWLNRSADLDALRRTLAEQGAAPDQLPRGEGRWQPFDPEQSARLRETYADDLHWLTAGADGLATLTEDATRTIAGTSLPQGAQTKGQDDDQPQGKLA